MKKQKRRTKEERIKGVPPPAKGASAAGKAREQERLLHELQVHQVELETQNHELREAQLLIEVSRNRYADLYDFAPVGYVTFDAKGIVREINLTAAGMVGVERMRLVGVPFHLHVAREDLARFRGHLARLSNPAKPVMTELHLARKGGGVLSVVMQSILEPDAEGRGRLYRTAITDITARQQAEEALRDNEARLQAILDTAVEGIITIGERGVIESFNQAAEKLFGYPATEAIGQNIGFLMPSPYREEYDRHLSHHRETTGPKIIGVRREVSGRHKDGGIFPMELSVSEVRLAGRRIFTGIFRDITERKQWEQRLAADLDAMTRLQKVGMMFVRNGEMGPILVEMVDVAMAIGRADFGGIQLVNPAGNLEIVAQCGFPRWWIDFWNNDSKGQGAEVRQAPHR
jgi:PAS domain S-box-containing protein